VGERWSRAAWSMLAGSAVCLVVGLVLGIANGAFQQDVVNQFLLVVGLSVLMVVGALLVAHRPGNAIGWLFSAIALLAVTGQLAGQYAIYAYAAPRGVPGAVLAAWYGSWPWWLALALVFTPLLFPPVGSCRPAGVGSPGWPGRRRRSRPC
jgi:two-component system, NarL family, sensor kinase